MVIVYVSHLVGDCCAGPTYSVPSQIMAQSKYDDVLWFNLVRGLDNPLVNEWNQLEIYKDLDKIETGKITDLPRPFCCPDLIIFEAFYDYAFSRTVINTWKNNFKYIIVPRGELTSAAQKRKKLKKNIANLLFFNKFVNKSVGIQYLTEGEKLESFIRWKKNSVVIPNGICIPILPKSGFSNQKTKFVMIGRIEPYAKGIDLLLEAITRKKTRLREEKCVFDIYGPDVDGKIKDLNDYIYNQHIADLVKINGPLYGQEKTDVLLEADIFVMTSRLEGLPMALLEALSYGLPCIITEGTNMTTIVEEYKAGWTAKTNVESIANAFDCLLDKRKEICEYSLNARKLACCYSWRYISDQSHGIYLNLLQGKINGI